MKILSLGDIKEALPAIDLLSAIEQAFIAYSNGKAVVPPVGELLFDKPPGDVHIKYGYLTDDEYYVVKIASGFYDNPKSGLPSNNGLMLLFNKLTGQGEAVLLDEGLLTDIRTAVAGAISARYLANPEISCIGIAGTGVQARLQLEYLKPVCSCREVLLWGRDAGNCRDYAEKARKLGFNIRITDNPNDLLQECDLIVTTTPAREPLLTGTARPGTHITAVGADTHNKQELGTSLLAEADVVVADSIAQCLQRGEIHKAINDEAIKSDQLLELGNIITGSQPGRTSSDQVTIADLTGVATQDICIAKAVFESACNQGK